MGAKNKGRRGFSEFIFRFTEDLPVHISVQRNKITLHTTEFHEKSSSIIYVRDMHLFVVPFFYA